MFTKGYTKEIWEEKYNKCREFANKQLDTSRDQYRRRNQSNPERIIKQISDGKMGELLAYDHLKSMGFDCTEPDFEIYTARLKSFDADLISGDSHVHVKTQCKESADRYGTSWVFQAGGSGFGHSDPCISGGKSWCIFVVINHLTSSGNIYGPLDMEHVRRHFKDPKLKQLVGIKKCIYLEDIEHIDICLRPETKLTHDTSMDYLDLCFKAWVAGNFCMECELTGTALETAKENDWVYECDKLMLYDPQKMIDTALGKIELAQYKAEFSKIGLPDEYRWKVENSSSDTDSEEEVYDSPPEESEESEESEEPEEPPPKKKIKV